MRFAVIYASDGETRVQIKDHDDAAQWLTDNREWITSVVTVPPDADPGYWPDGTVLLLPLAADAWADGFRRDAALTRPGGD